MNNTSILHTKLQKPNLPSDYIHQANLLKYLNEDNTRPFTLVSAGAGYGKSTLISSWLSTLTFKNCWLSIDESDNDIRTFVSYFIAAIQSQTSSLGEKANRYLFSPNVDSLDVLTHNLINDLSLLDEDILLVLDDFQYINNFDINSLISSILKYPPKNFHLVIISRTDPPIPLHKLRAANKMKDIRSSHLRLSNEDIKLFFKNNSNIKNNESIISLFNNKFEGWITGIRLLKIHLSYSDYDIYKLENFIQNNNLSETYFVEELIKHLDNKSLQFLLQTSVFIKFNSKLSDFVLSSENNSFNSEIIIKELLAKNLFLINLDNTNNWYRYHHIFQSVLQAELKKTYTKQSIINIHKQASEWFIENNFYDEAFYHIKQINDTKTIANFVRSYMYMPLNANKWFVLEKWLKHIPDIIINNCPILLTAQMWVMQHKGLYWAIPELINKVEEIKANNTESYEKIKHQLVFFEAIINFWNANIDKSIEQFDYVRKKMAIDKLGTISLSTIYYGIANQISGDSKDIYNEIQLEISRNNLHQDYKMILLATLIYIKLLEGDLFTAERITEKIIKLSHTINNDFYVVWGEFLMGYITFQQYKTEEALSYFNKAIKLVYLLNTHAPVDSFAATLLILKQLNKTEEYEQVNNELSSFINDWNNPTYNTVAYSLKTRLSIIDNDIEKASKNFKKADLTFDPKTMIFNIEVPRITYCKLLLSKNSLDEAIIKLTEIHRFINKTNNIPIEIEILILFSVAYYKKNNMLKAMEYLTQAIVLAEKGHFVYVFIEQAEIIKNILPRINSNNKNINEFVSLLINTISNKHNSSSAEKLSNRELDIIKLLALRLSNQEIADKLFISTSTVKRHTINIYHKLGVNKRRDAVEVAKKLEIIE